MEILLWQIATVISIQTGETAFWLASSAGIAFRLSGKISCRQKRVNYEMPAEEAIFWCSFKRVPNWRLD
jgi:hypothetical protein